MPISSAQIARRALVIACLAWPCIWSAPAHAEDTPRAEVAVRVSAGLGAFEELTWAYPGVELVARMRLGASGRGLVEGALGFAPVDNHTYLSDGRMQHTSLGAGVALGARHALRLQGTASLGRLLFHADPDVLLEHPGVDLLLPRAAWVPIAGVQASYQVTSHLCLGAYARASLSQPVLFRENDQDPQATGAETRARLLLFGLFAEMRVF